MTYNPLHHKYRPQTFAQLVGQDAIAATLSNAIASQRLAPAYLFTGPRGTGKTSSARILAKSLNCQNSDVPTPEPCGECESCRAIANGSALDVIEIDAASNTGVDNIRDLIERAQFAPVSCRYKVYVIDECHMLSTAAFNALLKTLEEPPARVVFVLATTDPQRVLPTIISRCQRFDYRRIPLAAMTEHLQVIARQEQIEITETALTLVAQLANGGLRDAESLLDQLSLLPPPITPEAVWDLVGAVPERDLLALLQALRQGRPEAVIDPCRHLLDRGREPLAVLQSLANFYLHLLIAKTAPQRGDLIAVTSATWDALCQEAQAWSVTEILYGQQQLKASEGQLRHATQPRLWLEVALLGLLPAARAATVTDATATAPRVAAAVASPKPAAPIPPAAVEPEPAPAVPAPEAEAEPAPTAAVEAVEALTSDRLNTLWQRVLDAIHPKTAKALISEHCYLLSFEPAGAIAHIGVKSRNLLKIAKTKGPNIQAAFEQVWEQPVSVELQVAEVAPIPSASRNLARDRAPSVREARPEPRTPRSPDPDPEPATARNHGSYSPAPDGSTPPIATAATAAAPTPPEPLPTETPAVSQIARVATSSDLEAVTEQFAVNFKGEVIDLDLNLSAGDMLTHSIDLTPAPTPEPEPETPSGDDEIPF